MEGRNIYHGPLILGEVGRRFAGGRTDGGILLPRHVVWPPLAGLHVVEEERNVRTLSLGSGAGQGAGPGRGAGSWRLLQGGAEGKVVSAETLDQVPEVPHLAVDLQFKH